MTAITVTVTVVDISVGIISACRVLSVTHCDSDYCYGYSGRQWVSLVLLESSQSHCDSDYCYGYSGRQWVSLVLLESA